MPQGSGNWVEGKIVMEYQPSEITDNTGKNYIMQSARVEDAEELMAFAEHATGESLYFPWSREGCPGLWENAAAYIDFFLTDSRYALLLLRDAENIVGLLELNGFGSKPEYRHRCTLAPGLMKSYWGRGLVQSLWNAGEMLAVSLGYEQAEAHVDSGNLPCRRAIEKNGWTLYGVLPKYCRYADGSYSDKYMYVKQLMESTNEPG